MNQLNIKQALEYGSRYLKEKGIESHNLDSKLLLMHVLKIDKIKLYTTDDKLLETEENLKYNIILEERGNNKPIAYIVNNCEFMGIDFYVNENVLIPRPDTEILVELIIDTIKKCGYKTMLDIGTGSGAIPVSVSNYVEGLEITAVDISEEALKVAKQNAAQKPITFTLSDLFQEVEGKFDIIVSNPPYIRTQVIEELGDNVKKYEPRLALDGGSDGLDLYKRIIQEAPKHLNENGMIFFEIGYDQFEEVSALLIKAGFSHISLTKDLSGLNRVIGGKNVR